MPSADFCLPARSPEVSSAAFRAQSPDLRSACLMDMDFTVARPFFPRSRLVSGSCSVTRRDLVYGSETDFSDLVWANVWMFVRNRRQECEHDGGISASINIPPTTL